jgi:hypothetical protein
LTVSCYKFDPVWHHPLFYIYIEGVASQFTINHTIWSWRFEKREILKGQLKHLLIKGPKQCTKSWKEENFTIFLFHVHLIYLIKW